MKALSVIKDRTVQDVIHSILEEQGVDCSAKQLDSIEDSFVDADLFLVDEQLFEEPGVELIWKIRQNAVDVKVFCFCSTWCDRATFVWLRDILGVQTVVMLPIDRPVVAEWIKKNLHCQSNQTLIDSTDDTTCGDQVFEPGIELDDKKLAFQKTIETAQARLRLEVEKEWERLTLAVDTMFEHDNNEETPVTSLAHQLKGSAGSLGLKKVSCCARNIETFIQLFGKRSGTARQLLRNEIVHQLNIGKSAMRLIDRTTAGYGRCERFSDGEGSAHTLLLVGDCQQDLQECENALSSSPFEVVRLEDPTQIIDGLESAQPDLLVFSGDLRFLSVNDICRKISEIKCWDQLPLLIIVPDNGIGYGDEPIPERVHRVPFSKLSDLKEIERFLERETMI